MLFWQQSLIFGLFLYSIICFIKSLYQIRIKKNNYGLARWFLPLGVFVWADGLILSPFWFFSLLLFYYLNDWLLFLLTYSLFWAVRSWGEVNYWLNQQFGAFKKNPPERFWLYMIFKDKSVWFVMQLSWQVTLVISLVCSLYFLKQWL